MRGMNISPNSKHSSRTNNDIESDPGPKKPHTFLCEIKFLTSASLMFHSIPRRSITVFSFFRRNQKTGAFLTAVRRNIYLSELSGTRSCGLLSDRLEQQTTQRRLAIEMSCLCPRHPVRLWCQFALRSRRFSFSSSMRLGIGIRRTRVPLSQPRFGLYTVP